MNVDDNELLGIEKQRPEQWYQRLVWLVVGALILASAATCVERLFQPTPPPLPGLTYWYATNANAWATLSLERGSGVLQVCLKNQPADAYTVTLLGSESIDGLCVYHLQLTCCHTGAIVGSGQIHLANTLSATFQFADSGTNMQFLFQPSR